MPVKATLHQSIPEGGNHVSGERTKTTIKCKGKKEQQINLAFHCVHIWKEHQKGQASIKLKIDGTVGVGVLESEFD